MTFEHGNPNYMDTGWARQRRGLPGSGRPRAGLLLPEPDQPGHSEGGTILPEGLQAVPDLQKIHGAAGILNGFDLQRFFRQD